LNGVNAGIIFPTVDMSGLSSATINLNSVTTANIPNPVTGTLAAQSAPSGSLFVGDVFVKNNGNETAMLVLASNTTVNANYVIVGWDRTVGIVETLVLGAGSNVFNANVVSAGPPPPFTYVDAVTGNTITTSSKREGGRIFFNSPTGSLKIRGKDGVSRSTLYVAASKNGGTGFSAATNVVAHGGAGMISAQYVDLSGHYADLYLSNLVVGNDGHGNGNMNYPEELWTNYFNFSTGILDTTGLQLGITSSSPNGTNYILSTCNLSGGVVTIGTNGITMAQMGNVVGLNVGNTPYCNTNDTRLNISGGAVTVAGSINAALQDDLATNPGPVFSLISLTAGSLSVSGNIYCGTPTTVGVLSPRTATLTLNGATALLDLTGHAIGSNPSGVTVTNNYLDVLNFQAGTLQNVSEINNGTTPLNMTGTGTLTLAGSNNYSGGTVITSGILSAVSDSALGLGNVTNASGAALQLGGGVSNKYIYAGASLVLAPGTTPVNLSFTGAPNNIGGLSFDGGATFQPIGTWGSTSSGATHQDNTHFSGTGTLLITTPSSLALVSSATIAPSGQSVTFTATVTGGIGTPMGTVTFRSGSTILATVALNGSGVATYTSSSLAIGANSITAVYNGSTAYTPSTATVVETVILVPIAVNGTNVVLQLANSLVGTNYVLQSATNLVPPVTWTPVVTNAGTGGTITINLPFNPASPEMFFRYQLQ
jgi:autotransporter-associated beta strand protein